DDAVGWKLLQPKRLKQWVDEEDLINAEGYELWLITTKARNGEDVTFERPVLRFDVFRRQPFPMQEDIPEETPELRLQMLDVDDLGRFLDPVGNSEEEAVPENRSEDGSAAADDSVIRDNAGVSDLISGDQPSETPIGEQSGPDAEAEENVTLGQTQGLDTQADGSRSVQAAMATLAVSGLTRKRRSALSKHVSSVSRILDRFSR
ncbi:MAG: hypothetical protein KDA89_22580, partial [Planctomycetaceae bacterium]|nr:hypothetical protein [Planctomycetaceae bacterium]